MSRRSGRGGNGEKQATRDPACRRRILRGPCRRAAKALITAIVVAIALAATAPALANYPTFTTGPVSANGGGTSPGLPNWAVNGGTGEITHGNFAYAAGQRGWLVYCTPYGGTSIVAADLVMNRIGGSAISGYKSFIATGGGDPGAPPAAFHQAADNTGALSFTGAISPTPCAGAEVWASGAGGAPGSSQVWSLIIGGFTIRDDAAPSASITSIPGGWQTGGVAAIGFTTSDNADNPASATLYHGVEIQGVPGASWGGPGGSPVFNIAGVADGAYTVRAYRGASGWSDANSYGTIYIDNNPPTVPGITGSSAWTNASVTVSVAVGSSDGGGSGVGGYQWSVDGGAWFGAGSSIGVSTPGVHTVQARSIDNVGRASVGSNIVAVYIDQSAPTITGLASTLLAGDDTRRRVDFTLADTGGSGFGAGQPTSVEAFIGGSWAVVASGTRGSGAGFFEPTTAGLAEGRYQWRVSTRDVALNGSGWTTRSVLDDQAFIVDRTAPTATGNVTPLAYPMAEVRWTATDPNGGVGMAASGLPANVQVQVENTPGVWVTLYSGTHTDGVQQTANVSVSSLAPGAHAAQIVVTDRLGHSRTEPLSGTINNDSTPPTVTGISVSPVGMDPAQTALRFTADDGPTGVGLSQSLAATLECSTDGATWALMADMNADGAPLVTDGANTHTVSNGSCPEAANMHLRLSVADKAGNRTTVPLAPGNAAFVAFPGNGFAVDRTPPTVASPQVSEATDGSGAATFTFTLADPNASSIGLDANKVATVQVEDLVDATPGWETVGTLPASAGAKSVTFALSGIADQQRSRWRVIVPDRVENVRTETSGAGALRIDRTGPAMSGAQVEVPGAPEGSGLANGQVRATFTLDDNQPTGAGVDGAPVRTRLQAFAAGSWQTVGQLAGAQGSNTLTASTLALPEGLTDFRLVVHDVLGNPRTHPLPQTMVDHSPPAFSGGTAFVLPGQRVLLRYQAADPGVGFAAGHGHAFSGRTEGGAWVSLGARLGGAGLYEETLDVSGLAEGSREVRAQASDRGGRVGELVLSVQVDKTPPRLLAPPDRPGEGPQVSYPGPNTATVCLHVDDQGGAGPAGDVVVDIQLADGTWRQVALAPAKPGLNCLDVDLTGLPEGRHNLRITLDDLAGNRAVVLVPAFVDNEAPLVKLVGVGAAKDRRTAQVVYRVGDAGSGIDPMGVVVEIAPGGHSGGPAGAWGVLAMPQVVDPAADQQAAVDLTGRERQVWAIRVRAKDRRGNTASSEAHTLDLRDLGADVPQGSKIAPAPQRELLKRNPRTAVPAPGGRVRFRVVYPKPRQITIAGRFVAPDGSAVARARLSLLEFNIVRREVVTDESGRFKVTYTPTAPGLALVRWAGSARVQPIDVGFEVEVVPFIRATIPVRTVTGKPLAVRGRFAPTPKALKLPGTSAGKRARHQRRRGPVKASSGQPVALYGLSAVVCRKFARPLGFGAPVTRKGLRKLVKTRIPARCWVPVVEGVLAPNGSFKIDYPGFRSPQNARRGTVFAQVLQVRVKPGAGWPFKVVQTPPAAVMVTVR